MREGSGLTKETGVRMPDFDYLPVLHMTYVPRRETSHLLGSDEHEYRLSLYSGSSMGLSARREPPAEQ